MADGFEDLVGVPGAGEDYFDPAEFEIRARLEDEHYWHRHRREVVLRFLREVCPDPGARLLELGCGLGTVATHLNAAGYRVDYGDIHAEGIMRARELAERRLGPAARARRFFRVDVNGALPPGAYDGVLLLDVIEHLPDDARPLENVRRKLEASAEGGGFLLLTVPAFPLLWSPWDEIEKHRRRYTERSLRALAARTGYRVERSTYFFSPLFFAALGVKALRKARALALGAPRPAERIDQLTETAGGPLLSSLVLSVLDLETPLLGRRLPLGTSLLALLRPR